MKKILLLTLCLILSVNIADAQYSDVSLNGPWIMVIGESDPENPRTLFIIFDGQGLIIDWGIFNAPDSLGTYSVESNGSLTGYIWGDDYYVPFTGQIYSDSTAEMHIEFEQDTISIPLYKVMDEGLCQGNWSGSFVEDTTTATIDVQMIIDELGEIESLIGVPAPITGRFYFESNYLAGFISTGDTVKWYEIMITGGALVSNNMTGTFVLECEDCYTGNFSLEREPLSIIDKYNQLPDGFHLSWNFPNPFNPVTTISYQLPKSAFVNLSIYNVAGQLVEILVSEHKNAGYHSVLWNASGVSSGLYFYRIEAGEYTETKKCLILK